VLLDCVVVGAGPAGLAASLALTRQGVDHVVLERGRVGQTWRTQRWDSLRLNNPGWMNPMLGPQPRDTYLRAAEVARRLDRLAAGCPVRESEAVRGLYRSRGRWLVRTASDELHARTVVVATGGENVARTPALAARLPDRVVQVHAADYRAPAQLPGGGVLVVGSAQSGYQIAEELLAAGRRVVVATSAVGRAPARHRGRATVEWLVELGFFEQRPEQLPEPSVVTAPQPLLAPGGRSASLRSLALAGAVLAGRLTAVDGERITFDASLAANIAYADAYAHRIRTSIDAAIVANKLDAPPATPDDDAVASAELRPRRALDLRADGIDSVVWCTGCTGDFSWLDPTLTDTAGRPVRDGATAAAPGLWYMGLRWLIRRGSGNFIGFPADAAAVAGEVATYLGEERSYATRGARAQSGLRLVREVGDVVQQRWVI
jgi:putative flavoprotein involved in K+ transport